VDERFLMVGMWEYVSLSLQLDMEVASVLSFSWANPIAMDL